MKVAFHTLGCKVNQYETESMREKFSKAGHVVVGENDIADAYIINTCTVTALADRKSRQYIRKMKKLNPKAIVLVTGCYVQVSPDEVAGIKGVDIICGTNEKENVLGYIEDFYSRKYGSDICALGYSTEDIKGEEDKSDCSHVFPTVESGHPDLNKSDDEICPAEKSKGGVVFGCLSSDFGSETEGKLGGESFGTESKRQISGAVVGTKGEEVSNGTGSEVERHIKKYSELSEYKTGGVITSMESRRRAYIKIEEGCDRFCTYCIIPFARGPVRSRDTEEIITEAKTLVRQGFKELILTGINTALYGDLPGLLKELDEIKGDFRIRLSSLEPTVIDTEDVKKILGARRLCHHLHLSAQSGSDKILDSMNRFYNRRKYLEIVKVIKDFDPFYGITTDIIAGFPGETEEDHGESLSLIREAEFCKVHAFGYSKRPGTKAADMKGQISSPVKKSRVKELISIGEEVSKTFMKKNIGRKERVLFEEASGNKMTGYTGNYIKAYGNLDENLLGKLVEVEIKGLTRDGVIVNPLPTEED